MVHSQSIKNKQKYMSMYVRQLFSFGTIIASVLVLSACSLDSVSVLLGGDEEEIEVQEQEQGSESIGTTGNQTKEGQETIMQTGPNSIEALGSAMKTGAKYNCVATNEAVGVVADIDIEGEKFKISETRSEGEGFVVYNEDGLYMWDGNYQEPDQHIFLFPSMCNDESTISENPSDSITNMEEDFNISYDSVTCTPTDSVEFSVPTDGEISNFCETMNEMMDGLGEEMQEGFDAMQE
jgi:hypothetical protein